MQLDLGSITVAAHLDSVIAIGEDFANVVLGDASAAPDAADLDVATALACALFVAPQPTAAELAEGSESEAFYLHHMRVGHLTVQVVLDANPEKAGGEGDGGLCTLVGPTLAAILGTLASLSASSLSSSKSTY